MRTTTLIIGLILLALGCNTSTQDNKEATHLDSVSNDLIKEKSNKQENTFAYNPAGALWEYQFDTILKDFKLVKLRQYNKDTLTIQRVENIVNKTWPKVQIKYLKTSKDTVYITIPESEVLTQQMGTSGADAFMISTTYSFTDLKGIKYVSYEFEVGDHANPGVYSRDYWKDVLK